jgi:hypothetical protein
MEPCLDVCFIHTPPVLQNFSWERHAPAWLLEPGWSPAFPGGTGAGLTKWTSSPWHGPFTTLLSGARWLVFPGRYRARGVASRGGRGAADSWPYGVNAGVRAGGTVCRTARQGLGRPFVAGWCKRPRCGTRGGADGRSLGPVAWSERHADRRRCGCRHHARALSDSVHDIDAPR